MGAPSRSVGINFPSTPEGPGPGPTLLESVALVLNSGLELGEVLRRLAAIALEESGAQRCSIFVLDGDRLAPRAALGSVPDEALWADFLAMGDIRIDDLPGGRAVLEAGRIVPIPDAEASPLIPAAWVERFSLTSLIVMPLRVEDEPCGVMVVEYAALRLFTSELLATVEAIGSYASIAVRNARLFDATRRRSELQSALALASHQLISTSDEDVLAERLLDASLQIVPAVVGAIGLLNALSEKIEAIAVRGTHLPASLLVSEIPSKVIDTLLRSWSVDAVVDLGSSGELSQLLGGDEELSYTLVPLGAGDFLRGGILLGIGLHTRLTGDEREALEALAAIASASLERSLLQAALQQQVDEMRVLHSLGDVLAGPLDVSTLALRLDRLLKKQGIRVVGICFRSKRLIRQLGSNPPDQWDREAWRSRGLVWSPEGTVHIPIVVGRRVAGSLKVRVPGVSTERTFLEALAGGVGEIATRAALRAELEDSGRERALNAERGRIASELNETVGQTFVAVALEARRCATSLEDGASLRRSFEEIAELADIGATELHRVGQSLASFPDARLGIVSSIVALAESFEGESGVPIIVNVKGILRRLPAGVERVLFGSVHEILYLCIRHSRCSAMQIQISFAPEVVSLRVDDDGTGASVRGIEDAYRVGLLRLRSSLDEFRGTLRLTSRRPRGSRMTLSVPLGPKR